jgi:pimeloyl-ACP methyl ester carboxylesterase
VEIMVGGTPAHVETRGQGTKTLLFVHGAGGTGQHFMMVKPPDGWRLVTIDLPGHGYTGGEARDDIFSYADWVAECVREIGGCDVLAGHSMGGAITMALALIQPQRLRGLILISTGARLGVSQAILDLCHKGSTIKVAEHLAKYAYGPLTPMTQIRQWYQIFGTTTCQTYLRDFTACQHFDIRERLGEITLPTLVVCGLDDRLTPYKFSEFLASHLTNAQLHGIPAAGHMVMLEQPEPFNLAVADFCIGLS